MSSHTHRHGKHFTVTDPSGKQIYESFVYNDPVSATFDPPKAFDAPLAKDRTLHYCSLYNNGAAGDGSPDPTTVTRRSHLPQSAQNTIGMCSPVACTAGKIAAACRGVGDDHACDTAAGANDGFCDACPLTGGESTENEMFILIGSYYIDTTALAAANAGGAAAQALPALDARGKSTSTEIALPPQLGCGSSHSAHAMHAGHAAQ